jgi:Kef-type K+ transport system membrane component KefB
MRPILGLVAVVAIVLAVRTALPAQGLGSAAATMALGFVLIVSFLVGRGVTPLGLPAITGYLLVGMAFGPHLLGWVHPAFAVLGAGPVSTLRLLDAVALGLIALSAGGELRLPALRAHARVIGGVIAGQTLLVALGVAGLVLALRGSFPLFAGWSGEAALAAALLFGVSATANSPETALAVIQELRSSGPVSEVVLAVTVVKDVVVISLFTVTLALATTLVRAGAGFNAAFLLQLGWEVVGSIALGAALGWLVVQYVDRLGHELPLLVLGVAFTAVAVLPALHLSGILACMVAGFYIENRSEHGDALIRAIEGHALPVYVVFFTIAGAGLDLPALRATWPLALALAGARLGLILLGTAAGAALGGAPAAVVRLGWSGFVAQAGVTLGLAILIAQRLPEIGEAVMSVLLAVIALNLLVGPVVFRLGLVLAREVHGPDV